MFIISMPTDFKVGDQRSVTINGQPEVLRWSKPGELTILPDDCRTILDVGKSAGLLLL